MKKISILVTLEIEVDGVQIDEDTQRELLANALFENCDGVVYQRDENCIDDNDFDTAILIHSLAWSAPQVMIET